MISNTQDFSKVVELVRNNILTNAEEAAIYAKEHIIFDMLEDIEQFIPYDTGALNQSVLDASDYPNKLVWESPYAEFVYNMNPDTTNWTRDTHPLATSNWVEVAKKQYTDDWNAKFDEYMADYWRGAK